MEIKHLGSKAAQLLKKYRYGILILVTGLVLMMIPTGGKSNKTDNTESTTGKVTQTKDTLTKQLQDTLAGMEGVGNVKVLLTISAGEETVYQVDESISTSDSGSTIQKETVIITGADRQQQPLISYIKPATYLGAIIVCQGADQPSVKLAVVDAVSKITGLSSDKISVVKMK